MKEKYKVLYQDLDGKRKFKNINSVRRRRKSRNHCRIKEN